MSTSLPLHIWNELRSLSLTYSDREIPILSGRGGTELVPTGPKAHWLIDLPSLVGVPLPGTEVRRAPAGDWLKLQVKGPNTTPGCRGMADKTAGDLDELGYNRTGDAGEFGDHASPDKGPRFRGRISENFEMATGSWVTAGELLQDVADAAKPLTKDVVVAGHDRSEICLIVIPDVDGMCEIAGSRSSDHNRDRVKEFPRNRLGEFNASNPNSCRRICWAALLETPPRLELHESTAKSFVNQRDVLKCRADKAEALYTDPPGDNVIALA